MTLSEFKIDWVRYHVVVTVDENGLPTLAYGEYPFNLPGHNVQIWEKQRGDKK